MNQTPNYVHIYSAGRGTDTHVTVNGKKLRGVTKVEWVVEANGRARAVLTLHASIDAQALDFEVVQAPKGDAT